MKAQVKSKLNLQDRVPLQDVIPIETPFLLYLDPSSVCNFKCKFCPTGHKELLDQSNYKRNVMDFDFYCRIVDSLNDFSKPVKVLRMNKIGEPMLNRNLANMVKYAKESGRVGYIDLATNASMLTKDRGLELVSAGLDRLNISIEGVNAEQYKEMCNVNIDFDELVSNIRHLFVNKKNCEVTVKIPKNYLKGDDEKRFFELFGDICDRIFVENLAPIWPSFDVEGSSGVNISNEGQYGVPPTEKLVCSYIFYAAAINADGTVSACCPDWDEKLVVGDLNKNTLKEIWNSKEFSDLRMLHLEGRRKENSVCAACGHIKYSQVDDIDPFREQIKNKWVKQRKN
ncbi:MAG: SPASM domain-containing protein [Fibrobacteres bacterium]|nr:SPASM domain-containing protein [Fibrobacterota bacterium]